MSSDEELEEIGKKWKKEQEEKARLELNSDDTATIHTTKNEIIRSLSEKNQNLESKLTQVAIKEFDRRVDLALEEAEKLGIDIGFINNPEELKVIERQIETSKAKKTSSREIPLSAKQLGFKNTSNEGLPLEERSYPDMASLMSDLEKEAEKGSKEAKDALVQLYQKTKDAKVTDFEFRGKISKKELNPEEKTKWKKLR